ncbi:hypothetical protein C8R44DRAFT_746847 [Mycena epipterygia]|nr:hypothetical protein C8R44DRAFT_746847 [Mycena epipterygia]
MSIPEFSQVDALTGKTRFLLNTKNGWAIVVVHRIKLRTLLTFRSRHVLEAVVVVSMVNEVQGMTYNSKFVPKTVACCGTCHWCHSWRVEAFWIPSARHLNLPPESPTSKCATACADCIPILAQPPEASSANPPPNDAPIKIASTAGSGGRWVMLDWPDVQRAVDHDE